MKDCFWKKYDFDFDDNYDLSEDETSSDSILEDDYFEDLILMDMLDDDE